MRGVPQRQSPGDEPSPVPSLRRVAVVNETQHQLVQDLGVVLDGESTIARALREAEVRDRGHHDVELRSAFTVCASCSSSLGKGFDELDALVEATRPAMDEKQRYGVFRATPLVYEVHAHRLEAFGLEVGGELGILVQLGFRLAPVEGFSPVVRQPLDVGERGAALPFRLGKLIWEPGLGEAIS